MDGEAAEAFLAEAEPEEADSACLVLAENWDAVMAFNDLGAAWVLSPTGQVLGLARSEIGPTMGLWGVPRKRQAAVFQQLRVMEDEVLPLMRG